MSKQGIAFKCNCEMCPQDYDIYENGEYVGNVYERHGELTVWYDDVVVLSKDYRELGYVDEGVLEAALDAIMRHKTLGFKHIRPIHE